MLINVQAFDLLLDLLASMQVDASATTSLAYGFGEFVYKPEPAVSNFFNTHTNNFPFLSIVTAK